MKKNLTSIQKIKKKQNPIIFNLTKINNKQQQQLVLKYNITKNEYFQYKMHFYKIPKKKHMKLQQKQM